MILITGAAQGLGAAIAKQLYFAGHSILVHYNKSDPAALLKECPQIQMVQGALSSKLIDEIVLQFPQITGLVNNVGNFAEDSPRRSHIDLMRVNVGIPMQLTERLLPSIERARGHIVNIGTAGILKPTVSCTSYAVTKAALWKYTLSLAKAVPAVKVNMVSPGALENTVGEPDAIRVSLDEVARLVAFLFTSEAITGQNIEVAGGFLL